jgi:hypothetical protein
LPATEPSGDPAPVAAESDGVAAAVPADPAPSVDAPVPIPPREDPAQASIPPPATDALPEVARLPLPVLPESRRQRFRVYWGDYTEERSVARLEYRLEHDGERYEIRTAGEAEGLISLVYAGTLSQTSIGRMGPAGMTPTRYIDHRGRRPERRVPDARKPLRDADVRARRDSLRAVRGAAGRALCRRRSRRMALQRSAFACSGRAKCLM